MGANAPEVVNTPQTRENLRQLIAQWNANRLDLFEISEPNEDGEFQGVMRFYFQEAGAKVATKCIRISSTATTKAVIETLIEKFRPDMRMLSIPQYALYEIHESGEERKLDDPERPLLVQLNWHSDDREGRFLLKRTDEQVRYDFSPNHSKVVPEVTISESFKRKLSKREKKQLKKLQEKTKAAEAAKSAAEKLYNAHCHGRPKLLQPSLGKPASKKAEQNRNVGRKARTGISGGLSPRSYRSGMPSSSYEER